MSTKLYVGNLSREMNGTRLYNLFCRAGNVASVFIPLDRVTRIPRGFALIEMASSEDAARAIWLFNGQEVDGCRLMVSVA